MSDTGRYFIKDEETRRLFYVEPITNKRIDWGDVNPATKKIEGNYGQKHKGSINEKESIINEENGFKNISIIDGNPQDYINKLLKS